MLPVIVISVFQYCQAIKTTGVSTYVEYSNNTYLNSGLQHKREETYEAQDIEVAPTKWIHITYEGSSADYTETGNNN